MIRRAHISTQNTKPDWPVLDGQANTRRNKVAAVGTGPQQRCCCWHRSLSKTGPEPTKPDAYFAGSGAIRGALRSAKTSSVQNPRWALCHVRQESASTSGQTAYVTILRNMISPLVRQKTLLFKYHTRMGLNSPCRCAMSEIERLPVKHHQMQRKTAEALSTEGCEIALEKAIHGKVDGQGR
jgi:hypothetical protein